MDVGEILSEGSSLVFYVPFLPATLAIKQSGPSFLRMTAWSHFTFRLFFGFIFVLVFILVLLIHLRVLVDLLDRLLDRRQRHFVLFLGHRNGQRGQGRLGGGPHLAEGAGRFGADFPELVL